MERRWTNGGGVRREEVGAWWRSERTGEGRKWSEAGGVTGEEVDAWRSEWRGGGRESNEAGGVDGEEDGNGARLAERVERREGRR